MLILSFILLLVNLRWKHYAIAHLIKHELTYTDIIFVNFDLVSILDVIVNV